MNITRKPVINVQTMLIENRLWTMRSYRFGIVIWPDHRRHGAADGVVQ